MGGLGRFLLWVVVLGGIGVFVGWYLQIGPFAKSPQTVEITVGGSSVVAGGRAKVWFAEADPAPKIEVSCASGSKFVTLYSNFPSEEVCGIRVRVLSLENKGFGPNLVIVGKFEVSWY